MATTAKNDSTIYRLTEIDTEEVSIVDRAANQRKFLVVKGANMAKAGSPVVPDGKGGHTTTEKDGAPAPTVPDATPTTPALNEPVLNLSPETKAELIKRLAAATSRIDALKAMIAGAVEVPGSVEVPSSISDLVAELLTGITHGEVAKGEVAKGLPQFSAQRVAQIQAARSALDELLGSITKPAPTEPEVPPEAAPTVDEVVAKAVAKALGSIESKLAGGFEKIATVIAKHGEAIEKQAATVAVIEKSSRATPRSATPEGSGTQGATEDDDNAPWPTDMSDPDKHSLAKTAPELRFTTR